MKIKVTKRQFEILLNNFHLIGNKGLELSMSGKLAKMLTPELNQINEQKAFKVDIWIGGFPSKVIVYSDSSGAARLIVGKLFPKATIYNSTEVRGRL